MDVRFGREMCPGCVTISFVAASCHRAAQRVDLFEADAYFVGEGVREVEAKDPARSLPARTRGYDVAIAVSGGVVTEIRVSVGGSLDRCRGSGTGSRPSQTSSRPG